MDKVKRIKNWFKYLGGKLDIYPLSIDTICENLAENYNVNILSELFESVLQ